MDLADLHIVQTLVRTPNLSRASVALKTSQPRLSQRLAKIETELGVKLFERTSRGLHLSREGAVLSPFVRELTSIYGQALKALAACETGAAHELRVGVVHTSSPSCPSRILKMMRAWQPATRVTVTKASLTALLVELEAGELDAVLCYDPQKYGPFEWHPLFSTRVSGFSPASAGGGESTLAAFARRKLVLPSRRCEFRQLLDHELARLRVRPRVVMEVDDVALIRNVVRSGEAVTLLPESVFHSMKGLARTRITDSVITLTAGVVAKRKPGRATTLLLNALTEGRPI